MIIELAVGAGVVLLGALALKRAQRRREAGALPAETERTDDAKIDEALAAVKKRAQAEREDGAEAKRAAAEGGAGAKADDVPGDEAPPIRPLTPRGLRVGDVLLYADTELWLAGEVHLDEEGFALSVFTAPGSPRATHVAQLDAEAREIAFLEVTSEVPEGKVPTELPVAGMRLSLRRRGSALVRSVGEHLPLTTDKAEFVLLGGPGGKTLVVVDFQGGDRLALYGERVGREMYDMLPGGDAEP
jgi:hypothetical protein